MPALKSSKKKPAARRSSVSGSSVRIGRPGAFSRRSFFRSKVVAAVFILVFAAIGTYLHSQLREGLPLPPNNLARGLVYDDLVRPDHGPCLGQYVIKSYAKENDPPCTHPDPGPPGVDLRVRDKQVDADLMAMVAYDQTHPPLQPDASASSSRVKGASTVTQTAPADVQAANSLSAVSPVAFPCTGNGIDGYRVVATYAYPAGGTSRAGALYNGFVGLAQRINAVAYNSGKALGAQRLVRFATDTSCHLIVHTIAITGDINSMDNIENQMITRGWNGSNRKYIVWVDGGSACGQGDEALDDRADPSVNYNNGHPYTTTDGVKHSGVMFAVIWHPCWNYGEPHELMHTLGAVQPGAPHATKFGHCYDQHDVMCYDDGSGIPMQTLCPSSANVWLYDCHGDDYFNPGTTSGWLSTHWNTANSSSYNR